MAAAPTTIDAYLAKVKGPKRAALDQLRKTIRTVVPKAEECISYEIPAFRLDGRIVAGFAATAKGCSYFPFGAQADRSAHRGRLREPVHFGFNRAGGIMTRSTMRGGLLLLAAMAVGCGSNSQKSRALDAGGWTTVPPAHDAGASDRAGVDGKTSHDASPDVMARDARPDSQPARDAAVDAKAAHDASPDALLLAPMGGSCATGATCASGFCADGVCCNVACAGACVSCAATGRVGTCWPIDAGAPDPNAMCVDQGATTCGRDGLCDGIGGCALYSAGTACTPSSCSGNTLVETAVCDGAGACTTGTSVLCAPYACANGVCRTDCSGPGDCAAGQLCLAGVCASGSLGQGPCSSDAECDSGICAQGVCCASRCDGVCSSCILPGSVGTCEPLPTSEQPDGSVCP